MCHITFLHPDLGIGGAERLIVDAALGLKSKGHSVSIVTTHHDPSRCFEETVSGDIPIAVVGNWIPRSIFNKCYALMAYIRMIYASLFIIFHSELPDVVICDLVSVAVPIIKLRISNVIFYCHYPDQLLSQPGGLMKKIYRIPLDWLEEFSIAKANRVFVNSKFTANVFRNTFKRINTIPDILYPSLNTTFFDSIKSEIVPDLVRNKIVEDNFTFLSINRYERKKNLRLAIDALHELKTMITLKEWTNVRLIMAGGYDKRISENVQYLEELMETRDLLSLEDMVIFLKSPNDKEKVGLLKMCMCLLYTPENEHFGIAPIEAMYHRKPVIAVNSGGPTETIKNGETGYLCEPNAHSFAQSMSRFINNKNLATSFGEAGRKRVVTLFSFEQFSGTLDDTVKQLLNTKSE